MTNFFSISFKMSQFLGRQDCIESLRRDLVDLQGAVLEVFSRTGPVRCPSWKYPDKLSCHLDLVSLLDRYDFVDGEDEFNQLSHIVLLELMIDRLLLLLQSFNVHTEQFSGRHRREDARGKGCVSVGLVVRHYWNNLVRLGDLKGTCKNTQKETKAKFSCDETTKLSSTSPPTSSGVSLSTRCSSVLSSSSTFNFVRQDHVGFVPDCPDHKFSSYPGVTSTSTRNVSCQTEESSLVPCDACARVQSVLRQTGDALVELCQTEGLPSSLQHFLLAVEDHLELGHLTASDVSQWAKEQHKDTSRLGKHLQEVRATVQPLRDRLTKAEARCQRSRSQLERAQEELKREMAKHQTSILQMEHSIKDSQQSSKEIERGLKEEQDKLKKEILSLEDNNARLKEELAVQLKTSDTLACEKNELQDKVSTLERAEEARRRLEERTQLLEHQVSETQLLLDKETAKYSSACRQQESMQAKQKSLLERVDALDQECEELQTQLGESEERQAELQDQLKRASEEKEQLLAQFAQQQVLRSELQQERQRQDALVDELRHSVAQLREDVENSTQRERLLVAFPELTLLPEAQPQSTGNVLFDMEQQLQANNIRIGVLEQENVNLHSTLSKLRERAQHNAAQGTSPEQTCNHNLSNKLAGENDVAPARKSPLGSSCAEEWKYGMQRRRADGGESGTGCIRPEDPVPAAASAPWAASPPSFFVGRGRTAAKTNGRIRHANISQSHGMSQRKKLILKPWSN